MKPDRLFGNKNPHAKVVVKAHSWGRYRFRGFKLEDLPRDFNAWRTICFLHRVEQSLCHCKESMWHIRVTPKIRIPKKDDLKAWDKLEKLLREFPDHYESVYYNLTTEVKNLTKREMLLYRFGLKDKIFTGSASSVHIKSARR